MSVRVRAGPSRWVSQYRLPRTTTALARPVSSTEIPSTCWAAATWYGRRPARGPFSHTSSRRGSDPGDRSSTSHRSPAHWYTTRVPSLEACRA
ncbi:hypothetical protein SVIOM74S_04702 [Streptomyces violarus]